jgi:hypothetical protein
MLITYGTRRARARASGVLLGLQMPTDETVISYLRRRPRRKDRPRCGAKTRAGGTCMVRVEFGKARCTRIAEAQRRRGRAYREGCKGVQPGTPMMSCTAY